MRYSYDQSSKMVYRGIIGGLIAVSIILGALASRCNADYDSGIRISTPQATEINPYLYDILFNE